MGILRYSSNNSGGSWWLSTDDWRKLEEAGWVVHWNHAHDDPSHTHDPPINPNYFTHDHSYDDEHVLTKVEPSGEEWLGALAKSAAIETNDPEAAIAKWESVLGMSSTDEGCNCCGEPHNFYFTDDKGKTHYSSIEVVETRRSWS